MQKPSGYELRDHTADIALYAWSDTLEGLFASAGRGLYAAIGELKPMGSAVGAVIELRAGDAESLLHDFLSELLFHFETKHVLYSDFEFTRLDDNVLRANARVADMDERGSILDREVKAVTFHDVSIVRASGQYQVTFILDI